MKFKNTKNKASSKGGSAFGGKIVKSPSNSRTIPAQTLLKIYRGSLKIFIVIIFILTVVIVGLDLEANVRAREFIDLKREELTKKLVFWEDFIEEYKDYRDAYLQASILEYKLGNTSKAKMYLEKGLSLDPNSEDGKKIEELLNK